MGKTTILKKWKHTNNRLIILQSHTTALKKRYSIDQMEKTTPLKKRKFYYNKRSGCMSPSQPYKYIKALRKANFATIKDIQDFFSRAIEPRDIGILLTLSS